MDCTENICEKIHLLPRRATGFKIKAELKLHRVIKESIGVFAAQFIPKRWATRLILKCDSDYETRLMEL